MLKFVLYIWCSLLRDSRAVLHNIISRDIIQFGRYKCYFFCFWRNYLWTLRLNFLLCALSVQCRVDHEILIKKLSNYVIQVQELKWFKSYLPGRSQCTMVNGIDFKVQNIKNRGFSRYMLWSLAISNLDQRALKYRNNASVYMYTDDSSLSWRNNNMPFVNEAHENLEVLDAWVKGSKLSLNVDKRNRFSFPQSKSMLP